MNLLRIVRRCASTPIVDYVNPIDALGLSQVAADLARLEPLLSTSVETGEGFLDDVTTHLIKAGGKRLRPLLGIAAATAGERPATMDDLMGAVSVELVHLASLYHDDVMDEAEIRRNVESVNARYGNLIAIVAGDYLLARSAAIAADLGTEIASVIANTLALLTQGQVSEVRTAFSAARTRADYNTAIGGKTAALMATACRVGALTAGRSREEIEALTTFGYSFGMMYQLRDDVLDVTATDGKLGKPAGQDLAEGIYTLPVLVALEEDGVGAELTSLLGKPLNDAEREAARLLVEQSSGIAATVTEAHRYLEEARTVVAGLPNAELAKGFVNLGSLLLSDLPALV